MAGVFLSVWPEAVLRSNDAAQTDISAPKHSRDGSFYLDHFVRWKAGFCWIRCRECRGGVYQFLGFLAEVVSCWLVLIGSCRMHDPFIEREWRHDHLLPFQAGSNGNETSVLLVKKGAAVSTRKYVWNTYRKWHTFSQLYNHDP